MEWYTGKPSLLKNLLVRLFLFCLMIIGIRFAYVVTIRGESCDFDDFCFFSSPGNPNLVTGVKETSSSAIILSDAVLSSPEKTAIWSTEDWRKSVDFYSSVFQDLIAEGYLLPNSKSLCLETPMGHEVYALKEIGVLDAIGIYNKSSMPLVISGQANNQPFKNNTFDFIFSSNTGLDSSLKQGEFAAEVGRTLKPEGFLVVHTTSKDAYSFNSFIDLFNCCKFIRSRELQVTDARTPIVREIVMKKFNIHNSGESSSVNECLIPEYKKQLVKKAELLIREEPLKPWITLKRNIKNVKYLSSMADINFKQRYVYVDVGARSYGSSIVSWFKKQYPKQNKTFDIYAIEADKVFHEEYRSKKGVTLLPYAAWVRNESLFFEVNDVKEGGARGMGRIKPVQSSSSSVGNMISGFDFANWLKNTVTEKDFVVVKMDVEGTEFDLIPRLYETGAICLIDEIFLECHYNRWQKCCPGQRSPKYEKTYGQCLELFTSLRQSGVLVHQWW